MKLGIKRATVPVQPLIAPLFDTASDLELMLALVGSNQTPHDLVKDMHANLEGAKSFDEFLRLGMHSEKPVFQTNAIELNEYFKDLSFKTSATGTDNLDLLLIPDFHAWDGRFINNGWMQECPNPMTKLTWDNAILISPKLGKKLQAEDPGLGLIPDPTMLNKQGQIAPDNANFGDGRQKAPIARINFGEQSIEGPLPRSTWVGRQYRGDNVGDGTQKDWAGRGRHRL